MALHLALLLLLMSQPAFGTTRALGHRGGCYYWCWPLLLLLAISRKHLHSGTASKLASGHQDGQAFSFIDNLTVVSISMARPKIVAISLIIGHFRAEIKTPKMDLYLLMVHWPAGQYWANSETAGFLSFACFSLFIMVMILLFIILLQLPHRGSCRRIIIILD